MYTSHKGHDIHVLCSNSESTSVLLISVSSQEWLTEQGAVWLQRIACKSWAATCTRTVPIRPEVIEPKYDESLVIVILCLMLSNQGIVKPNYGIY